MNNKVSSFELQKILGAHHRIETLEFWNTESERVLYADMDKSTVLDNLEAWERDDATIYYVTDLAQYWAVI